ncbi:hypothetical protein GCM10010253_40110 [Streptomyces badius]|uniref:Uncharacterized protein n=1 Tax=Streptomyces badius TaxID=1941 RepID=A0ABQ2TBF0_STRBA|nr:hypothetical protein GCM10010253_40110 [Streptomyces badius]
MGRHRVVVADGLVICIALPTCPTGTAGRETGPYRAHEPGRDAVFAPPRPGYRLPGPRVRCLDRVHEEPVLRAVVDLVSGVTEQSATALARAALTGPGRKP